MSHTLDSVIAQLDLEPVACRLRMKLKWPEKRIESALTDYRGFLQQVRDAGEGAYHRPPSEDVDEVWHAHILHTQKYADDCDAVLGWFFHHLPDPPATRKEEEKKESDAAIADPGSSCGGILGWFTGWFSGNTSAGDGTSPIVGCSSDAGASHADSGDTSGGSGADAGADGGGAGCGGGGDGGGAASCGGGSSCGGGGGCGGGGCGGG